MCVAIYWDILIGNQQESISAANHYNVCRIISIFCSLLRHYSENYVLSLSPLLSLTSYHTAVARDCLAWNPLLGQQIGTVHSPHPTIYLYWDGGGNTQAHTHTQTHICMLPFKYMYAHIHTHTERERERYFAK